MKITLRDILLIIVISMIVGGVIVGISYPHVFPCPEVERLLVDVPIEIDPIEIDTAGTVIAEEVKPKKPNLIETIFAKKDTTISLEDNPEISNRIWRATVDLAGKEYTGTMFLQFEEIDRKFTYDIDIDVMPDTVYVPAFIDVEVPQPEKPYTKWFSLYVAAEMSFGRDTTDKLVIDGGAIKIGFAIKRTVLITVGPDTHERFWIGLGVLFR
jgi:hypothetical protein